MGKWVPETDDSGDTYFSPDRYYTWGLKDGELTVYSECCADTLHPESLRKLYRALKELMKDD